MDGLNAPKDRLIIKIIVLGSSNVGKSALIKRYTTGKFSKVRQSTLGSDFMTKIVDMMGYHVIIQIWVIYMSILFSRFCKITCYCVKDTAGQERFQSGSIGAPFYRGSNGCLLVYDVTNEASIEQLVQWRDELMNRMGNDKYLPIVVVGNKIDILRGDIGLNQIDVHAWCQENKYGYVETSAKDDLGVHAAITAVVALAIEQIKVSRGHGQAESATDGINLSDMYSKPESSCSGCLF